MCRARTALGACGFPHFTQRFAHSATVVEESAPSYCLCCSRGQSPDVHVAPIAHAGASRLCCIRGERVGLRWKAFTVRARRFCCRTWDERHGLMPLCHARQCDSGGRVGAEHGANGRMFGSFSASAQVGVAVRYIRHRVREVRGEPPCSPGLRVRVIERSFVTVLLFG